MVENVAVYFVNYSGFVLMLRDRYTRNWMTPGGCVEPGESAFESTTREFLEETSSKFPTNYVVAKRWLWRGKTAVFLVFSREYLTPFTKTSETCGRWFFHYSEIQNVQNMRSCVKNSFSDLNISAEVESFLSVV